MARKTIPTLGLHETPQRAQGIEDCAWTADGERCHYPGTVWRNVHGTGPGYCRFHVQEDMSAAYGAQVVVESRSYKPRTQAQRDHDAVFGPRGKNAARLVQATDRGRSYLTEVTPAHGSRCICEICFPKRMRVTASLRQREPGDDDEELNCMSHARGGKP